MRKIAFIFPGQGAQTTGMGKDLYENFESARKVFDRADSVLEKSVSKICFEGPDEVLKQTVNTQSCLLTVSIAALEALKEASNGSIKADYTLGHSLGEYSALYTAGVMDLDTTFKAIQKRADLMQKACECSAQGGMSAILGLSEDKIKELHSFHPVLSIHQIVITGKLEAVNYANELIKEAGAKRVVPLAVSGGFHSKLMQSASNEFETFVNSLELNDASIPVVTNVDAELTTKADDFRSKMPEQISSSVYWSQSIQKLLELGVDTFIELGNGKVLAGLNRKICPAEVKTYNVFDKDSLMNTVNELNTINV